MLMVKKCVYLHTSYITVVNKDFGPRGKSLFLMYFWTLNSNMFSEFLYHPPILRYIRLCHRKREKDMSRGGPVGGSLDMINKPTVTSLAYLLTNTKHLHIRHNEMKLQFAHTQWISVQYWRIYEASLCVTHQNVQRHESTFFSFVPVSEHIQLVIWSW
jgi:hypothetical protein